VRRTHNLKVSQFGIFTIKGILLLSIYHNVLTTFFAPFSRKWVRGGTSKQKKKAAPHHENWMPPSESSHLAALSPTVSVVYLLTMQLIQSLVLSIVLLSGVTAYGTFLDQKQCLLPTRKKRSRSINIFLPVESLLFLVYFSLSKSDINHSHLFHLVFFSLFSPCSSFLCASIAWRCDPSVQECHYATSLWTFTKQQ